MCRMLYIASDMPLAAVAWDEERPAFNTSSLGEYEIAVKHHLSKQFVLYLGAHTGCSCGFCPEDESDQQAPTSVSQLRSYLIEAIRDADEVEVYACWDGEQAVSPSVVHALTPEDLSSELLCHVEPPWLAIVRAGAVSPPK